MLPENDHRCAFRDEAERLREELKNQEEESARQKEKLEDFEQRFAALERRLLGPKTEKMPPMPDEVRKLRPAKPEDAKRLRQENARARAQLQTEIVPVPVPAKDRACPACGPEKTKMKPVGNGTPSVTYHYIAAHFRRVIYQRETLACTCGRHIVTAPCPDKLTERSPYGASFVAALIVHKCEDGIPLYRMEKQFERVGIPLARSTMTDLFHRGAERLQPIADEIQRCVAASEIVFADETSLKMQSSPKRAFVWTFLGGALTSFVFSPTRSGEVPLKVLGDSQGELMADLYTGYNQVTLPGRRRRAGCLAHARRKVFEAKANPEAAAALEIIRDVYVVEHDAKEAGLQGTAEHLALRTTRTRPLMARLLLWARAQRRTHGPKSLIGRAAGFIVRNRKALTRFLYVPGLPPDNNRSEAALRRVALGRKNYLFVGHEEAGENIAGLFSIVASCTQNNLNPVQYLTDVLSRIDTHPQKKIRSLLPDQWKPLDSS